MKMAVVATIVCAVGIIYGVITIMQKTPYWWASVILGIALFCALYVGVRLLENEKEKNAQEQAKKSEQSDTLKIDP
jgi:high-affinity Fe2+/Pb2+ permease